MVIEIFSWILAIVGVIVVLWVVVDSRVKTVCSHYITYWKTIENGFERIDPICGQIVNQVYYYNNETFTLKLIDTSIISRVEPYIDRERQHVLLTVKKPEIAESVNYFVESATESQDDRNKILDLIITLKSRMETPYA